MSTIDVFSVELEKVQDCFEHFNDLKFTKDGYWKKLPYDEWKELNNALYNKSLSYPSFIYVHIEKYDLYEDIEITLTFPNDKNFYYFTKDKSFGEYFMSDVGGYYLDNEAYDKIYLATIIEKNESEADAVTAAIAFDNANASIKTAEIGLSYNKIDTERLYIDNSVSTFTTDFNNAKLGVIARTSSDVSPSVSCINNNYNTTYNDIINRIEKLENKEENKNMKTLNLDFGPINPSLARLSIYGLAIKSKSGTYVSYDPNSRDIIDVDLLNFDGSNYLYKIPVAIKDISVGDVIVHNNTPVFVTLVPTDKKSLFAVDPLNGERKEILLTKSPFGFNYVTKIVNLIGNFFQSADPSEDNPFGNMLPFMLMSNEGGDMLPLMLMANGNTNSMNPMLMAMMFSKDKNMKDMLPFMLMANSNMNPASAHKCTCGSHCGEHKAPTAE